MKFTDEEIKTIILSIWHERVLEDVKWLKDMSAILRRDMRPEGEALLLKVARGDREIFLALVAVTVWARSFRDDYSELLSDVVTIASLVPLEDLRKWWRDGECKLQFFMEKLMPDPLVAIEPAGNC